MLYNPSTSTAPGVFSSLPTFSCAFDSNGSDLCAINAVDVDRDGDVDLVGSFSISQSTTVLSNERLANARKPQSVLRLLGAPLSGPLSAAFVPDGIELEERANAILAPGLVLDRFTFKVFAAPGERLRLRILLRGLQRGVSLRIGLFDAHTNRLRWVHAQTIGTDAQEIEVVLPDAARFVSAGNEVQAFVMSRASGLDFIAAIDQISAEVVQ